MDVNQIKWTDINKEQLKRLFIDKELSDAEIAKIFNVKKGQVVYKRRKFNISLRNYWYDSFRIHHRDEYERVNKVAKSRILKEDNLDDISRAITHFVFRNGPVEDMHANNQLTQNDMKVLNKYMMNHVSGIIKMLIEGEWLKLEALLEAYKIYGSDWDKAEPEIAEINDIFEFMCNVK